MYTTDLKIKEGNEMNSILIKEPKEVEIIDRPMVAPKEGEALLKLLYGGICGSDLGSYRGSFAYFKYPQTPGHEFSAEVIEVNSKDPDCNIKKGMIVTCNPYFNCQNCYSCKHGHVNACMDNQTMGVQREGAFSEYVVMPIERIYDGKGLSAKTLATVEPFCIGRHGIDRAKVTAEDRVLVIGAGTIGLLAAIYARSLGAEVWLSDISEEKLEGAKNFGFDKFIVNSSPKNLKSEVERITGSSGFDVTVEAVGLPSTFQNAIDSVCFGGRMVLIGVGKKNLDFNFTMIQKKELNIFGSRNALKSDFIKTIDEIKEGKLSLDGIITKIYPYKEAAAAFRDLDKNSASWLKVVLDFTK